METRKTDGNTQTVATVSKSPKCSICRRPLDEVVLCNWHQGRCPHMPSLAEQILNDPYRSRFYNLINFLKGKIKWH
jgi:ferritin-like protein